MKRDIIEILKQADCTKNMEELTILWDEIANTKPKYPLEVLMVAQKHIRNLALQILLDQE